PSRPGRGRPARSPVTGRGRLWYDDVVEPSDYYNCHQSDLHPVAPESRSEEDRHEEGPMSRNACPSLETLAAFALGELPEPELCPVAEHLDVCPECEEQAGRLDGMTDPVVSELRRLPDAGLDTEDADPVVPESWGEFRIVRELGRGGMGVVCE